VLNLSGTTTSYAFVYSGGTENILNGGLATGPTGSANKISGGTVNVQSGGKIDHVAVFDGGILNVAGTVLSNNTISSGGIENVLSGGSIGGGVGSGTGVSSGGTLNFLSGASGAFIAVYSGGTFNVQGTVLGTVGISGGLEIISSGGVHTSGISGGS